jgi:hypothetical protein
MKSEKAREYASGRSSVGGGRLGMMKSTRMGCTFEYGGSISAISMAVIPTDQMSAPPL